MLLDIDGCIKARPSVIMQGIRAVKIQGYAASASRQALENSVAGQVYQVVSNGILIAVSLTGYGAVIAAAYKVLEKFAEWVVGPSSGGWEAMPELYKVRMVLEFRDTHPPMVPVLASDRGVEYVRKMAQNARATIYMARVKQDPDFDYYPDPRALADALKDGKFPILDNAIPAMVQDRPLPEYAWAYVPIDRDKCTQSDIEAIRIEEEEERQAREKELTRIRLRYKL